MQTKTTLYIGAKDKDSKRQEKPLAQQREIIADIIQKHSDGATLYTGDGIFKHEDGTRIVEKSTIAILYNVPQYTVKTIADALKIALNQESIAVEFSQVNFDFI